MKARHLFVLISCACAPAWGADPARSAEARTTREERRILLVVAAEPREVEPLRQVAAELLGRLSVSIRAERVDRIDTEDLARSLSPTLGYLALVYIDLREPSRATLWFVDPAHDRILLRQLDRAPSGDELLREELGHILETSTEGLLSGAEIGLPRASVLAPAKANERAPSSEAPAPSIDEPFLQGALLYEVAALSTQVPFTHGPEASLYLAVPPRRGPFGIWLTAQYRFPVRVETPSVGARIEGGAFRAMLTFDALRGSWITLRCALGGGVDVVRLSPETLGASDVALTDARLLTFPMVRAAWGLEFRASSMVSLWSRLAADFDASATRYVFDSTQGERLLLRPWVLRPALAVGAAFP